MLLNIVVRLVDFVRRVKPVEEHKVDEMKVAALVNLVSCTCGRDSTVLCVKASPVVQVHYTRRWLLLS